MAVTEVNLLFTDRGATDDLNNHRTYTRMYEVLTNSAADGEDVVSNASVGGVTVPIPGDALDIDAGAICISVEFRQSDDSPTIWYVTCEYDSDPPTALGQGNGGNGDRPDNKVDFDGNTIEKGERQANPLNEPAQWTLTFETHERPATDAIKVKYDGTLEMLTPDNWAAGTDYTTGALVQLGGNVYFQVASAGVSGPTGPSGTGSGIADNPTAWAASTAYSVGDVRRNAGLVFECTTGGTSAGAGGPAAVGDAITDGSVVWKYRGVPAEWNFVATLAQVLNDPLFAPRVGILNSAGLPFDPPVMIPIHRIVLSVTKNMPFVTMEYLLLLQSALNITTWRGIPPRCAQVRNLTHDGGKELNGIPYVTGKWEIALDPDTHDVRILDAGHGSIQTLDTPDGPQKKFVEFKDPYGNPMGEVPLNGAGAPLDPEKPPVFLRFVPSQWRIIDFNAVLPF